MSAGFTSGPWAVNPLSARVDCQAVSKKGGLLPVAQMLWPTDERTEVETEANARLIAAAPDLYEACKAAIPAGVCLTNRNIPDDFTVALDCTMGDLRKIAAALAKATQFHRAGLAEHKGETEAPSPNQDGEA